MGNLPGKLPPHLDSECGNALCKDCEAPVKKKLDTGRWYITVGHCGFNSPANNKSGYQTRRTAIDAYTRYRGLAYSDVAGRHLDNVKDIMAKRGQIREAIKRGLIIAQREPLDGQAGAVIQALYQAGFDFVRRRKTS